MPVAKRLRIAVVDDHEQAREMWTTIIHQWPHGKVVLEATDGVDYEEQLATHGPVDLVVLDLSMPRRNGFETTLWIREHQPDTKVLIITFDPHDTAVYQALQAGAHGVLGKSVRRAEFHQALEALRTTGRYANDLLMRQLTHQPDPRNPERLRQAAKDLVSPRELVFGRHYVGDDQPSIARTGNRMKVSEETAETYRKRLIDKTGARTRTALVRWFIRNGLLTP